MSLVDGGEHGSVWDRTSVVRAEVPSALLAPSVVFIRRDHITAPNTDFARVADVDGDGDLDILAADRAGSQNIEWHENVSGLGDTFTKHEISRNSGGVRVIAPGDVDGDGDVDFFALEPERTRIRLYLNDGTGSFELVTGFSETAAGITYIESADVDEDGRADLFTVDNDDDLVALWWNPGLPDSGDRMKRDRVANLRSVGVEKIRVADIDGDGLLDFTTAERSRSNNITWWRQTLTDGDREWTNQLSRPLKETEVISAPAGDIDNDGDMDLFALRRVPYIVFQWLRQPDGSFVRDPNQIQKSPGGDNAFNWNSIDLGDMDGDGDLDFVTSELDGQLCWYGNPLISGTAPETPIPGRTPTNAPTIPAPSETPPAPTVTLVPGNTPTPPPPTETPDPVEATPIPADIVYLPRVDQS